ncbi:lipopolysaccharide biosynthesis protein [Cyclobacterium roseum]|uniref:lipopolysaccharide biosynthesis protein n=1 Tax=Cyclobacterium roseum TaxID=2666137 RepID=UPI0013920F45|nr:lipopolysaccharide biosynthesis protein [Cyclobacterium roseum]
MTLKTKVTSNPILIGIKWTSIQFALDTVFRFSIRLILAKLLFPEQFGLIGMAAVFISVASAASDLGMGAALIQKKEDKEAEKMYNTAFWSGLAWGLCVFILVSFVIGPIAAYFYEEPLLLQLIPVLSLGILIKPFSLIHTVILTRAMDFKTIAKIFNTTFLIAGVIAITAAFFDYGVWALVINSVLGAVFAVPIFFYVTKWRPRRHWNIQYFKDIFGFGAYSTGTLVFSNITYNIDNLIIGKMLGASLLGSYTLAFSFTENFRQMISGILNKVMYPVFGKNQDDKIKLESYFLKIIHFNSLIIYPLMTFLLLFADEIIIGFFGIKWQATVVPLQILSVAIMVHSVVNSFTSLIRGLGKPKLEMKIIVSLTLLVLIPGLSIGIYYFGIEGAAYAILLNKVALATIGLIVLKREINLNPKEVFYAIKSALIGISLAICLVFILNSIEPFQKFIFLGPAFIFFYSIFIYRLEKKEIQGLIKNFH